MSERQRLFRDRCRHGRIVLRVEVDESVVLALFRKTSSAKPRAGVPILYEG